MTTLLLVERAADVAVAAAASAGGATVCAVTAEAVDALERAGVEHRPLAEHVGDLDLAALEPEFNVAALRVLTDLEEYVAARDPEAPVGGEGFLRGQRYYVQYSIGAIVSRTLLVRAVIETVRADRVQVVDGPVHSWFRASGYDEDPWLTVLRSLGCRIELLDAAPLAGEPAKPLPRARPRAVLRWTLSRARRSGARLRARRRPTSGVSALRVASVGPDYDWAPVFPELGAAVWRLELVPADHETLVRLAPRLHRPDGRVEALAGGADAREYRRDVDAWLAAEELRLEVAGVDVLPALAPELRTLAAHGPDLCAAADGVAAAMLERVRPDVVTCFATPWLALGRLVEACRRHGVPVVCFQHGGSFGTHPLAQHEQTEFSRPDLFLSYGPGIRPGTDALGLRKARLVPVGSTLGQRLRDRATPPRSTRRRRRAAVLWLGALPTQNALPVWLYGEETRRFLLERSCLEILALSPLLDLRYRPFPGAREHDAIAQWAARVHPSRIRFAGDVSLRRAVACADLVVTTLGSSTVWNEVLALDRPLLLYCDDRDTRLDPAFARDLDTACNRCRTSDELVREIHRLAEEGTAFVDGTRRDPTPFLERYVLCRDDGQAAARAAAAVLAEVERSRAGSGGG